jgi:hypothetical protein
MWGVFDFQTNQYWFHLSPSYQRKTTTTNGNSNGLALGSLVAA